MEISQRECVEGSKQREEPKGRQEKDSRSLLKQLQCSLALLFKTKGEVPLKPVFLSFFLFVVGACFLYLGTILFLSKQFPDSAPSLLLGVLCIIPGTYYSFSILQILRGIPGYSFDQLDIS